MSLEAVSPSILSFIGGERTNSANQAIAMVRLTMAMCSVIKSDRLSITINHPKYRVSLNRRRQVLSMPGI